MGELQPTKGTVRRSTQARFALVNQHHADQINIEMTPLEFLQSKFPGDGSYAHIQKLRGHLSSCGIMSGTGTADLQNLPVTALSGGQRSRVALAAVSFAKTWLTIMWYALDAITLSCADLVKMIGRNKKQVNSHVQSAYLHSYREIPPDLKNSIWTTFR